MVEAADTIGDRASDLGTSEGVASSLPTSHSAQMKFSSQCWVCSATASQQTLMDLTHTECSLSVQDTIF